LQPKSPFLVVEELLSPLQCEQVIDDLDLLFPDVDADDHPIKKIVYNEPAEAMIYERVSPLFPQFEQYYNIKYKGTEPISFEWYPETSTGQFNCENSRYLRKKWVRTENRDLTAIVFLSDYQPTTPFDNDYEVYGGKLEFPQWGFGFNPIRGTMIVFPSDPHFINITTQIQAGELYQARIQMAAERPFTFDPKLYPGDYRVWFGDR
jgi:hypothetical protein